MTMSAYQSGFSGPNQYGTRFSDPIQFGSTFSTIKPPTSSFGQPVQTQPTVNFQIDARVADENQQQSAYAMAFMDPNSPVNNENPVRTKCPCCNREVTTETEYVVGEWTYTLCTLCIFSVGLIPFAWIPFLVKRTKDVSHTCPSCKGECGKFERVFSMLKRNRVHAIVKGDIKQII